MNGKKARQLRKWWGAKHVRHCNRNYNISDAKVPTGIGVKTLARSIKTN